MIIGVTLGLLAAFCQSSNYLFSKRYVAKFEQSTIGLLIAGHIFMGVLALILFPFFLPKNMPSLTTFAVPLIGSVVWYLCGQTFLLLALHKSDASRVSPLLGLKIIILALISIVFTHQHFFALQWVGIVLSVCAAYLLGMLGKKISLKTWLWVLCACLSYSLSDLSVKKMLTQFQEFGLFHASVLCTCFNYIVCGILACIALIFYPVKPFAKWKAAIPFALSWYSAMLFLFACFGTIGVVFGNIVQSTRGIMSIAMGSYVAKKGYVHIEESVSRKVVFLRLCAGVLMIAAIVLFYIGHKHL